MMVSVQPGFNTLLGDPSGSAKGIHCEIQNKVPGQKSGDLLCYFTLSASIATSRSALIIITLLAKIRSSAPFSLANSTMLPFQ